jgi:methionyl-tRNA formyltransferase
VTALINGDLEIGATLLFGVENYDKGNIVFQSKVGIQYPLKINDAIKILSNIYSSLLSDLLLHICESKILPSITQNENFASYSLWRDEEDYFINWNEDSLYIKRFIDSVGFPYKGACCYYEKKLIRIEEASIVADLKISNRITGKAIMKEKNCPIIVCKSGLIKIDKAIYENGDEVTFKNFRIRLKNDPL